MLANIFSKIFKRHYGLFYRERLRGHPAIRGHERSGHLCQKFDRFLSQYDVEMYFGELDPSMTWWFQETGSHGRPKGKPLWVVRRHRSKVLESEENAPSWKRLAEDVKELVEPIREAAKAYRALMEVLNEVYPQPNASASKRMQPRLEVALSKKKRLKRSWRSLRI